MRDCETVPRPQFWPMTTIEKFSDDLLLLMVYNGSTNQIAACSLHNRENLFLLRIIRSRLC